MNTIGNIEQFNVKSDKWNIWIERLEQFFIVNDIKDEKKVPALLTLAGTDAYTLFKDLCMPDLPANKTYTKLVQLMENHLQPAPNKIMERFKFKNTQQAYNENVADFVANLKNKSVNCNFGTELETNLRDQFVWGLSDDDIKKKLLAEGDIQFKNAVKMALSIEMNTTNMKELVGRQTNEINYMKKKVKYFQNKPVSNKSEELSTRVERFTSRDTSRDTSRGPISNNYRGKRSGSNVKDFKTCFCCGKTNHIAKDCYFKNLFCSRCGKKGHLIAVCKQRNNLSFRTNYVNNSDDMDGQYEDNTGDNNSDDNIEDSDNYFGILFNDFSDEKDIFNNNSTKIKKVDPIFVKVEVENQKVMFELDTGSNITAISKKFYDQNLSFIKLQLTDVKFKSYNGSIIKPVGVAKTKVCFNGVNKMLDLYVINDGGPPILGRVWLSSLPIQIKIDDEIKLIQSVKSSNNVNVNAIMSKYQRVFNGKIGLYNKEKIQLEFKDSTNMRPIFFRHRPLAFSLRNCVDIELNRLLKEGIIEEVDYSEWGTPIVPVLKSDNSVRICGDYKTTINPFLRDDNYPIPLINEIFAVLSGGVQFTKLDLSSAYQQVELDETSKLYTTISTHRGLFKYNRLPFGVKPAANKFQKIISKILAGIEHMGVFFDDICITGKNREQHSNTLETVLNRLQEAGLTLKRDKCTFFADSVKFLGYKINRDGIHMTEEKVRAINKAPRPENVSELKAFLGSVNYYSKFLPNYSEVAHPLYQLLRGNVRWNWTESQNIAFEKIKKLITSDRVLIHYSMELPLKLSTDASQYGVGAVLSHVMPDKMERPIAFISRCLSAAERKYSQLEKEALAIIFAVRKFHQYIFGREFTISTDHMPLITLFNPRKGIPEMTAHRIQRWALILSSYNYHISYIKGKENVVADGLSRLPCRDKVTEMDYSFLNFVSDNVPCLTEGEVRVGTEKDHILRSIYKYIEYGWPSENITEEERPYYNRKRDLYIDKGCIMWGYRVVIPDCLKIDILRELHISHMGITKMKSLARSYVWWPSLDMDIECMTKSCLECLEEKEMPEKTKMQSWTWPSRPGFRVHADFAGPFKGKNFLVIVDACSKWLDVKIMNDITSSKTINVFREYFATWGIPVKLVTDNAPTFTSAEFQNFLKMNGIIHQTIAPYHPQSNGAAENAVRTFKNKIKVLSKQFPMEQAVQNFLFGYRTTGHCTTNMSPAELHIGRKLKTRLDKLIPHHYDRSKIESKMESQKRHFRGNRRTDFHIDRIVMTKDFRHDKWIKAKIIKCVTEKIFLVKTETNLIWKRHADQMRSCELPFESAQSEEIIHNEKVTPSSLSLSELDDDPKQNDSYSTPEEHEVVNNTSPNSVSRGHSVAEPSNVDEGYAENVEIPKSAGSKFESAPRRSSRVKKPRVVLDL